MFLSVFLIVYLALLYEILSQSFTQTLKEWSIYEKTISVTGVSPWELVSIRTESSGKDKSSVRCDYYT